MAYLCTSRAGWLAAADCFRMTKSLALKATERIWNVRSNRAMEIGGLYGLWEFRRRKPLRGSPSLGEYGVHAPEVP
ncbi:uncharacterized protein TNCV_2319631 [Trichonephila clavipes]|nr:uncharacterized protein TNCV_2319631 [Trichonephila clavipes]